MYWPVPKHVSPESIFWGHKNTTLNNMYAKFHSNIPFSFEVMSKKRILDAFFCISLRQSWKKVVGTLKIYCHNHCSSINHGNEWDTSVFIRTRLPSDVPLSVPTPLNQCWKSCYDCGQHIWDQHCYGGMGAALQCKVIQTVPTFFSMIVWAKCKKMHLKFVFCS